jgi:serine phosphatase RsbU (regulator of sigma subunit)
VTAALPVVLAVVVLAAGGVLAAARRSGRATASVQSGVTEEALTAFVERSLDLGSLAEVLGEAAGAARAAFGAGRAVVFEPAAKEGGWDGWTPGEGGAEPVPDAVRGVFSWLRHNPDPIPLDAIAGPRFGAMRIPLGELRARYGIDVLVPLVARGEVLGAIGLELGRRPTPFVHGLLDHFRIEATAAATNVRLHREAAHKLTLEKEVDLASAVQHALVPPVTEGAGRSIRWAGHYRAAGQQGSDFWSAYDLPDGRLLAVIGDVIGTGLAGSMVSAVAKSCCDTLAASGKRLEAGGLLTALNRALHRPARPIHLTCFAAIFDPAEGSVQFANAGHPMAYHLSVVRDEPQLGVLSASGPMLGDAPGTVYRSVRKALADGDVVLLYTDGVVEAPNAARAPFGERRLQRALLAAPGVGPSIVRDRVLATLEEFRGDEPPTDDEALIAVRVGA